MRTADIGPDGTDGGAAPGGPDESLLSAALRRAEEEARPRTEFRVRLRASFAAGGLQPSGGPDPAAPVPEAPPPPAPGPRRRPAPVPRWIAYPAAAAALLLAALLSGALEPRAVPEPLLPAVRRPGPLEEALVAAERRIAEFPSLSGRRWASRVVEGRPVLLPAEIAFGSADAALHGGAHGEPGDAGEVDAGELRLLVLAMAGAESLLAQELPTAAAVRVPPLVTVVAPSRGAFEALVAPAVAPLPVGDSTVAFALRGADVLLLSPGALDPGGPPCEEMDVVHEAVHAWLRARSPRGRPLPLWVEEGLAGMVSQEGAFDTKEWCRGLLAAADQNGIDPLFPAEVMEVPDTASLAALVKARAPCDERPYTLIPVFHAHAESLVAFLLEDHPGCVHRAGFLDWLGRHLSGAPLPESPDGPAFAAARAFGFESPEALFRARDGWLAE